MKIRSLLSLLFLAYLLVPSSKSNGVAQNSHAFAPPPSGTDVSVAGDFSNVPLSFELNQGQSDPSVRFLSRGNGYSLFLTDSAALLVLAKHGNRSKIPGRNAVRGDVIRMEFSGASTKTAVRGVKELPGKANYFIGNDPAKWRAGVRTYAQVRYEDVYPGVDLVYYGNQRKLEYDFVVAANADSKALRLHFQGTPRLRLTRDGDLTIQGKNGEIAFHKPVVYQMKDGVREPVEGYFQMLSKNDVGFRLGRYDRTRTLVIDPALAYSTYLGGSGGDGANAVAVDAAGNFYVVGGTTSIDFPVTSNAFQKVNNGQFFHYGTRVDNAFITKFDSKGSVIYSTYLGGSTNDEQPDPTGDFATAIAVDAAGNAYVTGYTSAYNFPVTANAFQTVNKGALTNMEVQSNAFVTKLDPTGSSLIYSTLLGGTGASEFGQKVSGDGAAGVAVDPSGSAYVVGNAASFDFPVTSGAFQQTKNATSVGSNLFITKFNPSGSALVYSTYLGGSGLAGDIFNPAESAGGIVIDSAGNAYVTGASTSRDFPVTDNAYQTVNNSYYAGSNAVIAKLNPTGSALVYSTYLGGNFLDGGKSIARDAAGNVYVTGYTGSANFPTTPGAFQTALTGNSPCATAADAFVTKLNPTGSALVYSTLLGGDGSNSGSSIAVDAFGSAYVVGSTQSTEFPVTPDAFQKVSHQPASFCNVFNVFVTKFDPTGSALIYSTYIGSSSDGSGLAVDAFGDAYITGQTCSTNFPLAGVPFQATNKTTGGCTAFVSKFIVNTVTGTRLTSNSNPQKAGVDVTFTAAVTPNTGNTIPTGSVVFSIDGTPQITVPLDDTGHATYSTSAFTAGQYDITAAYSGSPTDSGSSASLGQLIIGPPARIAVAFGANQTAVEGTAFTLPLVAQVQDARGVPVPAVLVTFSGSGLTFAGNPAATDTYGQAAVIATPSTTGSLTAIATTAGVATPATFRLTATQ